MDQFVIEPLKGHDAKHKRYLPVLLILAQGSMMLDEDEYETALKSPDYTVPRIKSWLRVTAYIKKPVTVKINFLLKDKWCYICFKLINQEPQPTST